MTPRPVTLYNKFTRFIKSRQASNKSFITGVETRPYYYVYLVCSCHITDRAKDRVKHEQLTMFAISYTVGDRKLQENEKHKNVDTKLYLEKAGL